MGAVVVVKMLVCSVIFLVKRIVVLGLFIRDIWGILRFWGLSIKKLWFSCVSCFCFVRV